VCAVDDEPTAELLGDVYTAVSMSLTALDGITSINKRGGNNKPLVNSNVGTWTAELVTLLSSYVLEELDGNI
jgi:hypothetical protein